MQFSNISSANKGFSYQSVRNNIGILNIQKGSDHSVKNYGAELEPIKDQQALYIFNRKRLYKVYKITDLIRNKIGFYT